MAGSADDKVDWKKVVSTMQAFTATSGKPGPLNSKACGKLVADCLDKELSSKGFNIKQVVDASVLSKFKGSMAVNEANAKLFVKYVALEVLNKGKLGSERKKDGDPALEPVEKRVALLIQNGKPAIKATGTSKTGNVAGMTDTSKYTGAHKERFDESGKGKGIDGRADKADNSGYVGNYKGAGTFDQK